MNETIPPCGAAALDYVSRGLAVIPVAPGGKVPVTKQGVNDWSDNPEQVKAWWGIGEHAGRPYADPTRNVGIVCGQVSGGLVCIDVDSHDDVDGRETLKTWQVEHGDLPETITQITGGGGLQLFYRVDREIRPSTNGALGIDIRGDGSFAVAPPSLHPSGEHYEWSISPDDCDVADADSRVYAFIDYVRPDHSTGRAGGEKPLFELPDVIERDRNNTLFKYACSLRERGLGGADIATLVETKNSTNCKPPLPAAEVRKICQSVLRYNPGNEARRDEAADVPAVGLSVFNRPDEPAKKMADETVEKVQNVLLALDEVREGVKLNVFDGRLHVLSPCIPGVAFKGPHVLEAGESVKLRTVLERDYGIRKKANYEDALLAFGATEGQQYDPMAAAMESLPKVRWLDADMAGCSMAPVEVSEDGGETWFESQAVVGTLTAKYLGVEPTSYSNEVEKLMFRQLVARAMRPGCKADQMMVLVGKQGTGKSTFVSLLPLDRDFYLEGFSDFNVEDLKRISGKLVVEIPELDGFTGKDKNRIKSIITQTTDNYRESYARTPVEHPRTALFFGTTNDGTFLNDTTGSRRYLLIESGTEMMGAHPGLFDGSAERDIRRAWGETVALFDLWGEERFLKSLVLPREAMKESAEVQEKYTEEDSTRESVLSYIDSLSCTDVDKVNVKRVAMEGLGFNEWQYANMPKWMARSITSALDECEGWTRAGKLRNGKYGISRTWVRGMLPDSQGNA